MDESDKKQRVSEIAKVIFSNRMGRMEELDQFRDWFVSPEEKAELIKADETQRSYNRQYYAQSNPFAPSFDESFIIGSHDSYKSYMTTASDPFQMDDTYEEREVRALDELGKIVDKEIELSYFLAKRFVDRRLKVLK